MSHTSSHHCKDFDQMREKVMQGKGFIAALDQSGGSTPKALKAYGVDEGAYSNDDEMFAEIHKMRSRIIKAPAFTGEKILGAILFEKTMDNDIDGTPTAEYLWEELGIVPFLKVDKGLAEEENGVQLMKPMPELDALLVRAVKAGVFGTKMRSVIHSADEQGIAANVAQQFEVGRQILAAGLIPIIEPEVNIHSKEKAKCEELLRIEILKQLDRLPDGEQVMLKLTLPEITNLYDGVIDHPKVMRVVALSGGYDIDEACLRLEKNKGMIASFSRALSNDLRADQSDDDFNKTLGQAINEIYDASIT